MKTPLSILICITMLALSSCYPGGPTVPKTNASGQPVLSMARFCGPETYEIEDAQWNLYRDEEDGVMNLWLSVQCGAAIRQCKDTEEIGGEPDWELNLVAPKLTRSELVPGFKASIPVGYDDAQGGWITNFYFSEHNGSDKNTIEILEEDGTRLRIRITGEIIDVNYYDDSKPKSKLVVETWFEQDPDGQRTMS